MGCSSIAVFLIIDLTEISVISIENTFFSTFVSFFHSTIDLTIIGDLPGAALCSIYLDCAAWRTCK